MRLLIVNAEGEDRSSLLGILQANGHPPPVLVATGQEALALLGPERLAAGKVPIDVILVDADLPGEAGLEACRRFGGQPALKDLPLLVMTGRLGAEAYEVSRAAGACDFVRKPVQPPELLGRLHAACELKRQLDECRDHTTQLEGLNRELQRLSVMDELTGVANRRFFNMLMGQEWARAVREVVPFSLIMIDIDFFKDYNDHFGHQKGDECLRRVAGALGAVAKRPGDYVARYGGEEFTVILPHTGIQGAMAVAEALRTRVESLNLAHPRSPINDRVTISLGVASTVPERSGSPDALVAAADLAIYEAKREGRNRVRACSPPYHLTHAPHPEPRLPHLQGSIDIHSEGPSGQANPEGLGRPAHNQE